MKVLSFHKRILVHPWFVLDLHPLQPWQFDEAPYFLQPDTGEVIHLPEAAESGRHSREWKERTEERFCNFTSKWARLGKGT